METLAKRIQRLRNTLNLNQTDFAGRIGRKQQTIGGWERGDRVPIMRLPRLYKRLESRNVGSARAMAKCSRQEQT